MNGFFIYLLGYEDFGQKVQVETFLGGAMEVLDLVTWSEGILLNGSSIFQMVKWLDIFN